MDLRVQKNLENIERAFLSLREEVSLNKIKVNDLCMHARINKSTFYRHYADIFALSDAIEEETIDDIMRDFTSIDCLFTDPDAFISGMLETVKRHKERILIVFDGRLEVLTKKMEERLKRLYLFSAYTVKEDITLSFLIGGANHVFMDSHYELDAGAKILADLLKNIVGRS